MECMDMELLCEDFSDPEDDEEQIGHTLKIPVAFVDSGVYWSLSRVHKPPLVLYLTPPL